MRRHWLFLVLFLVPFMLIGEERVLPPFTGKVVGRRVRMRLCADTSSPILRECVAGELVAVVGEEEGFYAVVPPEEMRAYLYRTFVLDGVIEGERVNVRAAPSLEAPIIGQLRRGTRIEGKVTAANNRWLEVAPPPEARLYISKDYIERVGDASFLSQHRERERQVAALLAAAEQQIAEEMAKSFEEIAIEGVREKLTLLARDYAEFESFVKRADELLQAVEGEYLRKKVAALEARTSAQREQLVQRAQELNEERLRRTALAKRAALRTESRWLSIEEQLYRSWEENHRGEGWEQYCAEQEKGAVTLHGHIEPYGHHLKNRPGDYLLVADSDRPIAYLYSAEVDLERAVGKRVEVVAVARTNNGYALPAYCVLALK